MKFKKTLAGLVMAGACLVGGEKAGGEVIDVPINSGTNLQSYIDNADSGDTLRLVNGGYHIFGGGSYSIDKDLIVDGNNLNYYGNYFGTSGNDKGFILKGDAHVQFKDFANLGGLKGMQSVIYVQDNASLDIRDSTPFCWYDSITFNSTGNLTVENNRFDRNEFKYYPIDIRIENFSGDINVKNNYFVDSWKANPPILVGNEGGENAVLNITGNTFKDIDVNKGVIQFNSMLPNTKGIIADNELSGGGIGGSSGIEGVINSDYAPNISFVGIPEPSILALLGTGSILAGAGYLAGRKKE